MGKRQGAGLEFIRGLDGSGDRCIEYPFARFMSGYGHIRFNGRERTTHSVSFEIHIGPVPEGKEVCHNCGNRACVNPRHLRVDTHIANMADKVLHGTDHRGERNGRSRLTLTQVRDIRGEVASGRMQNEVARSYGVSPQTINHIMRGRTWAVTP